ncbi:39S ribosomal protein S18a, mitochondrial [Ixodes scapularis]|uniref:39S ribosomal protein S18a, mitochondrial n=1 Tax=Ixodes scapularis TaxID=6945 RepID=UPI001A9E185D|nr:39S ribosomal protein S18a, mitochondrial [Ixodes scapularis]
MALPRGCNAVSLLYAWRSTVFSRSLRTTAAVGVKEIRERQEDGVTIYEGINVDSPRKGLVVKPRHNTSACPLCRVGLTNLKYTDVLILSQFVDSKGNLLPTSVTGLCLKQHRLVGRLVYEAQRTGLMHKDEHVPKERWQELNNYFGRTRLKIDFGKPLIDIAEYLKKPPKL